MRENFVEFMQRIFDNNHAEPAPPVNPGEECWYLPSFGVYHPRKPGQIRVVFDSSAQFHGVSLNDVLLTGPDLNNSLVGVLLRFRHEPIAITADIEQMFHSFIVREDHRNFLCFLWFKNNDMSESMVEYRMKVHVFGNSPSPAVAIYGLRRAALFNEAEFGADVRHFIERDFYVDDRLKSLPSINEAISLLKATKDMLAISNLRLHKIASNCSAVMHAFSPADYAKDLKHLNLDTDSPPLQCSLGLSWDLHNDAFTFHVNLSDKPFTRRVLATVNSLFDPLGMVAPITIQGKLLLRGLSNTKSDWDAPLATEKEVEWNLWKDSLQDLQQLRIHQTYTPMSISHSVRKEIHVFSDASVQNISTVAYLKVTDSDGMCHVGFIMGKVKLAPQTVHAVPRLELCAAVLAVEIAEQIVQELDINPDTLLFYTDSKVVLGYICNETRRFYVYVSNRVQRIREFTHPEQWRYIPTSQNPADVATRPVAACRLIETNWLTGPSFLQHPASIPVKEAPCNLIDQDTDIEVRAHATTCLNPDSGLGSHRFKRFSSWKSLRRAITTHSHCSVFQKQRKIMLRLAPYTPELLTQAESVIIKCVQREAYKAEIVYLENEKAIPKQSSLKRLDPVLQDGLLRIGGRLEQSTLLSNEKHPLVIPGHSYIATLLTNHYHDKVNHQGRVFTEGAIRAGGFWIVGAKRCISGILRKCITCCKQRGKTAEQKMADLPPDRISMEPPFTNVGLDVFGRWNVSARRTRGGHAYSKRWAVIFTCLSVRAIHIELIESMDTSSFINALRRFFAIRGPAKIIRSDCGTNFTGACRELNMLVVSSEDPSVTKYLSDEGCKWIFNPPHSSHMGGAWERMIGLSRRILDSMLPQISSSHLTHEMLSTLMAEICAIINARPLVYISTDPESPLLLTPAMILSQKVCTSSAPTGPFENAQNNGKECSILPACFGKGGDENTLHPFSLVRNGKTTNLISKKETWSF
ncbi:uncharacterized protein LOC107684994 [Sinocyclocheilus anshuiensis]|uniref:uncharacterized protein LOC107684994 n=1 Tax=Sinocyclocheilus anshuiensis TaxID=1608454 RepID=UPI0007B97B00|nr:PREDICTED: uncharacterized protein LOC107684994 [Sinocyclocheilus anshuiensis]